jgi:photosystem II stability/assembly factor-like uncharacterized protein/uncharacterized protein (DUF2164 family)
MSTKPSLRRSFRAIVPALLGIAAIAAPAQAQTLGKDSLAGMKWRLVGPFRGGRVEAVAGVPANSQVFYMGAVAGGVWKTTNAGESWTPISDKAHLENIGAIAVASSDANVIYVGTGEPGLRSDITYGNGMWKSTDAGKTWTHIGLEDTRHIAKVLIDPHDPNLVLVAAIGHAYGPNAERGVFRSTDGGKTWQKVLYEDDKTGAVDLVSDPHNPRIVYAAMYQELRTPWSFTSGGPGSGIYKSTDEGATWTELKGHGLPEGLSGRIGLAVGADSSTVYALIEAKKGGLYVSHDAGTNWEFVSGDHRLMQRPWYFMQIFADPKNADTIYVLNVRTWRSTDGGHRWEWIHDPHGDNHALWIDPTNPRRMIIGNDGGASVSEDWGKTWSTVDNQPTAQFYHVATDNRFFYYLYGAQQDNSTVAIASRTNHGAINNKDWYSVGGGESGYVVPDPADPDIVYAGGYLGMLSRFNKRTGTAREISPWPEGVDGLPASDWKYRFTWTAPFVISPRDPNVLYYASQVLFRSTDGGARWTVISPDLTRNDKSKQGTSGGPITWDQTSAEYYDVIYTIADSPKQKGLIWVGTDDGLIWLTRNDGQHWENVTPKDLPAWSKVSMIEASPEAPGTAYAAVNRFKLDDLRPYIWKTTDYGKTWTSITKGIPDGAFVRAVREDTKRPGLLFAATEKGVYVSFNDGGDWQSLNLNLPVVPVRDLVIKNDDLAIATHGRSFWILDDINPLRRMTAADLDEPVHFFRPAPAYRLRGGGGFRMRGGSAGANPPSGVILDYEIKTKPKSAITLDILDSQGKVVRKYAGDAKQPPVCPVPAFAPQHPAKLAKKAGLNRFVWNLRYEKPVNVPCEVYSEPGPADPLAVPGHYEARLTVDGKSYTQPIEVLADPREKATLADMQKQFDLMLKLRNLSGEDHQIVLEIRDLRTQLDALTERLGDDEHNQDVVSAVKALVKKITGIEDQLFQRKGKIDEDLINYPTELSGKLAYLEYAVDSSDAAPTAQEVEMYGIYQKQLTAIDAQWNEVLKADLPALNKLMGKHKIPAIAPAPVEE